MQELTGHCLCGKVAFRIAAPVRDVHHCHCGMCRRATGAAFATLVWAKHEAVAWRGLPANFRASPIATRGFCQDCGTSLFLEYDGSDQIALLIGAFNNPETLTPSHHYGIESRLPWADIGQDLPGEATDVHPQPELQRPS